MPSTWNLRRSATDSKLAGVCGGVAERWGLDPVLVRVGAVLLALVGGVGVILYLAGWLLLPVAGTDRAAVDDLFGGAAARWPRELWVTLVVVACVVSFGVFGAISPFGLAPALALLAVWWFGFHRPRNRRRGAGQTTPQPGPSAVAQPPAPQQPWQGPVTPFTQAAVAWQARVHDVRNGVSDPPARPQEGALRQAPGPATTWVQPPTAPTPSAAAAVAPEPPFVPRPDDEALARAAFLAEPDPVGLYTEPAPVPVVRAGTTLAARRLRLVTVTALGLTWLGLGIADALGVAVSFPVYAAAGLLVVALGLIAATRWGRAPGLLPAGALLALAAVVAAGFLGPTVADPARRASRLVEHPVVYTSAAAFPAAGDTLDFGDLDVDLSGLALPADATYKARVDTGRVVVHTPPGVGVAVRYAVDTGDVQLYGSHVGSGSEVHGDRVVVPPAVGQHTLTLDLTVDAGAIEVRS